MVPKEELLAGASIEPWLEERTARCWDIQLVEDILVGAIGQEDKLGQRTLVGVAEAAYGRLAKDIEGDKALELVEQAEEELL